MEKTKIYNNPGNIEGNSWAGDTGKRYAGGRFVVFDSPEMGVRALIRDIRTKIADKEINGNLDKLINKYAPPHENPTKKYANHIKKAVGKDIVTLEDATAVAKAIVDFENNATSKAVYADPQIWETASKLAEISLPKGTTLEKAKEMLPKPVKTADQQIPYPVTPDAQYGSMEELLNAKTGLENELTADPMGKFIQSL